MVRFKEILITTTILLSSTHCWSSPPLTLQDIPGDVFEKEVCKHLRAKDIKRLRLVSRQYRDVGQEAFKYRPVHIDVKKMGVSFIKQKIQEGFLKLKLSNCSVADFQTLAPSLSQLVHLEVVGGGDGRFLGAAAARILSQYKFPHLEYLGLPKVRMGLKGMRALQKTQAPLLESLDLRRNNIDSRAMKILSSAPWFYQLKLLRIPQNTLKSEGGQLIESAISQMPALKSLNLQETELDEDIKTLIEFQMQARGGKVLVR